MLQFTYASPEGMFILLVKNSINSTDDPRMSNLIFGNNLKSEGAKSGEYEGWGLNSKLHSAAAVVATTVCEVSAVALS